MSFALRTVSERTKPLPSLSATPPPLGKARFCYLIFPKEKMIISHFSVLKTVRKTLLLAFPFGEGVNGVDERGLLKQNLVRIYDYFCLVSQKEKANGKFLFVYLLAAAIISFQLLSVNGFDPLNICCAVIFFLYASRYPSGCSLPSILK